MFLSVKACGKKVKKFEYWWWLLTSGSNEPGSETKFLGRLWLWAADGDLKD